MPAGDQHLRAGRSVWKRLEGEGYGTLVGLLGKFQRERAELLISIAHPHFRPLLRQEAQRPWWP